MNIIEEKVYSVDDVFNMIGEEYLLRQTDSYKCNSDITVDGFLVHPVSLRYMTFYQKGLKCACCGKEGAYFKLCGDDTTNRRHFNLFADDGTLMTKDHIIPASKGGLNHVSNMQTMCVTCNKAKGNYYPDVKVEYIVARHQSDNSIVEYKSLETAAVDITNKFGNIQCKKVTKSKAAKYAATAVIRIMRSIETGQPCYGYFWSTEMR